MCAAVSSNPKILCTTRRSGYQAFHRHNCWSSCGISHTKTKPSKRDEITAEASNCSRKHIHIPTKCTAFSSGWRTGRGTKLDELVAGFLFLFLFLRDGSASKSEDMDIFEGMKTTIAGWMWSLLLAEFLQEAYGTDAEKTVQKAEQWEAINLNR